MSGIQYYVVDVETTGLNQKFHEVNEISIIRCSDRVQLTRFIKCEYPERASFDALSITNKNLADLEKGYSKEEVVETINSFLNEDGLTPAHRCFIAHNFNFDKKFIHALYEKVGKSCPVNLWLCTMALTKAYIKKNNLPNKKANLHAACDVVGIKKLSQKHASKVDSRNTYLLFRNLIEEKKINQLPLIKTEVHIVAQPRDSNGDDEFLDPSLLDIE